jgi:nucleotide-binding universal stress UspA family protein
MQTILCATRGGVESQVSQKAAHALARAEGLRLIYLYVVDTDFMRSTTELSYVHDAAREIKKLGEFILAVAVERAKAEGVEADGIVRQGKWQDEIAAVAAELRPRYVMLGSSGLTTPYEWEMARQRAARIRQSSGAELIIVLPTGELRHF